MRRSIFVPLACLALCGLGCSDEESPPEKEDPPSIYAIYGDGPETALVPFPSNRYTIADASSPTGLRLDIGVHNTGDSLALSYSKTVAHLNSKNGFSTVGGVAVGFTGPIDIHGIVVDEEADPPVTDEPRDAFDYTQSNAPFMLVDVDEMSPEKGKAQPLLPRWWAQAKDDYYLADEYTLLAEPAIPLSPNRKYAFVLTQELKAADGGKVGRSPQMEAVLSGLDSSEYAGDVRAAVGVIGESLGVKTEAISLATVFTTATVHNEVAAVAAQARLLNAPVLLEPWTVETPEGADGRVRFRAVFETPEYRGDDGKWHGEEGKVPTVQKKVGLEVFLAFSDAKQIGKRPVVLYAHGLGGTKDGSWGTSERLKGLNAAVFSIDSPEHGSRSVDPSKPIVATFRFFGIDQETQDFDIERARDNFRQMASDQLELVRLIGSMKDVDLLPVGAPDGVPDLDVSKMLYIGHSFGSVQGPTLFALAPEVKHAVWNVGGAGLMTLLRDSGTFGILVNALKPAGTPDGALGRFFAATQAIVDPGDPINYARYGTLEPLSGVEGWEPRDVLLQEVVNDTIVPNSTSELLARAAGLVNMNALVSVSGLPETTGPLKGNLPNGATAVMSQYQTIGGKTATHGELIFSEEARAQYVKFFASGLIDGHATCDPP
ncbi:MAG: hypothetical protein IPK82_39610 [Polyangiaceae bacterium]|nr:hypothetical protein [Polyangiaceae bacterium]